MKLVHVNAFDGISDGFAGDEATAAKVCQVLCQTASK
jgi:hypothetical protein